jgi:ABC-type multidrug transport system ATPase subunit
MILSLSVQCVSKQYRGSKQPALKDFSLELKSGILGLLGPNGAGKSTLMRIIATITKPSQGAIYWNGANILEHPDTIRKELGYLPQDFGVYPNLNSEEFLQYFSALKGIPRKAAKKRINSLLKFLNLYDVRKRPLRGFSGGMKQRLGIAQALLNDPKILIVDEPTVGLDPVGRIQFRHLLAELADERIIVLSTHIVSDIEATTNDIAIMSQGILVTRASSELLLQSVEDKIWAWNITSSDYNSVKKRYLLSSVTRHSNGLDVRVVSDVKPCNDARQVAFPSLEEAYLYQISSARGGIVEVS